MRSNQSKSSKHFPELKAIPQQVFGLPEELQAMTQIQKNMANRTVRQSQSRNKLGGVLIYPPNSIQQNDNMKSPTSTLTANKINDSHHVKIDEIVRSAGKSPGIV